MEFDDLSNRVIAYAIEIHRHLGTRLNESSNEQCLAHELNLNGIEFQLQHSQSVRYKEIRLDYGYRLELFVENQLIVELNSVDEIKGIHEAQFFNLHEIGGVQSRLLINLNVTKLKDGIKRFVLCFPSFSSCPS